MADRPNDYSDVHPDQPAAFELARLAAQLATGRQQFNPEQLTADAATLYRAAAQAVRAWPSPRADLEKSLKEELAEAERAGFSPNSVLTRPDKPWEDWPEDIARPPKFPATLNQFLRLIVKGKTEADRIGNYREFLRWYREKEGSVKPREEDELGAVADLLARKEKTDWTAEQWLREAELVRDWKAEKASAKGRNGAEALKKKRLAAKNPKTV